MDTGKKYTVVSCYILYLSRLEMDHLADLVRHKGIVPMEVTREHCINNSRIATKLMESAKKKEVLQIF